MSGRLWYERARPIGGAAHARVMGVAADEWRAAAVDLAAAGARLLSLWATRDSDGRRVICAAYLLAEGVLTLGFPVSDAGAYPRIDDLFVAAGRLQRAAVDLHGVHASGGDRRPWLRHAGWRSVGPPLEHPVQAVATTWSRAESLPPIDLYPFVRVEGEGVHEIAVGPVHAGTIEPGHFRFSVVGEKVLRLEERLGYAHKGVERRFETLSLVEGHRLAARVSGDSAVAFSWAYCEALECMAGVDVPPRASWLRALALEVERIANHLGDLGALGNDAGFAFGLAQFSRLKESVLRACERTLGQRYLFDLIVPGGVARDCASISRETLDPLLGRMRTEIAELRTIYDEHPGLRDRLVGAGIVAPELAKRLGMIGLAARASGQPFDLRVDLPVMPYRELAVRTCFAETGDVAARVAVRFDELAESIRLASEILERLPGGEYRCTLPQPPAGVFALGLIEGWRGPVMIALESGEGGRIARCHPHDPSALNWIAIEHAVIGNIVPDFPLINKSFNLSYSGHDL